MSIRSDNPIAGASEDLLRRGRVASSIATSLRSVDASQGYVYGILGPWGSGKTSLINLVRERLAESPAFPVIDFNPWMFSGTPQLLDSFFNELSSQLRMKDSKFEAIADSLGDYSALLTPFAMIPFIGAWTSRAQESAKTMQEFSASRKDSVQERRKKIEGLLAGLEQPIVVILDDIDRLTTPEIREIFKLVRLTASFPNIVYVLAFDRRRVEAALNEDQLSGRDYLEKILQSTVDIPVLPERLLSTTVTAALDEAITNTGAETSFDEGRWPDIFAEIIWPLITNMRDVRRYAASIDAAIREVGKDIELVDILALEAVRVFMPDTFTVLSTSRTALTTTSDRSLGLFKSYGTPQADPEKQKIDQLIESGTGEKSDTVAKAIVERLFPAAIKHIGGSSYGSDWQRTWLKARRVAHEDVYQRYLERFAGDGLTAFGLAEQIFAVATDTVALNAAFADIEPAILEDVIAAMEVYEGDYPQTAAVSLITALYNILPSIPERERGMWDLGDANIVVGRVVLRILRAFESTDIVEQVVTETVPTLRTLSSQDELVDLVGHREGVGHRLVTESFDTTFRADQVTRILSASVSQLIGEKDILSLFNRLLLAKIDVAQHLDKLDSPQLTRWILLRSKTVTRSQSMGSRTVHSYDRLHWDMLISIFGSEELLRNAVDRTRSLTDNDSGFSTLLVLVDKYSTGWRPERF